MLTLSLVTVFDYFKIEKNKHTYNFNDGKKNLSKNETFWIM